MTYIWQLQMNHGTNNNVLPKTAYTRSFEDAETLVGEECTKRNLTIQYQGDPVPNCSRYLASDGREYLITRLRMDEWN